MANMCVIAVITVIAMGSDLMWILVFGLTQKQQQQQRDFSSSFTLY